MDGLHATSGLLRGIAADPFRLGARRAPTMTSMSSPPPERRSGPRDRADGPNTLLATTYEELRRLAADRLRDARADHTLSPTALVHETYLKLSRQDDPSWNGREHFLAVAATALRQVLIDHDRGRNAVKRGGDRKRVELDSNEPADGGLAPGELVDLAHMIGRLDEVDERRAKVAELRLLAGMTLAEIAGVLEESLDTVKRDWRFARAWIASRMEGRE